MPIQPKTDTAIKVDSIAEKTAAAGVKIDSSFVAAKSINWGGVTGGTSTAYTATLTPAPGAYVVGQVFNVKFHTACGNDPTIDFNGLGAKGIKTLAGTSVKANLIAGADIKSLVYDGTHFILLGPDAVKAQNSADKWTTTSGTSTDYTATLTPSLGSYSNGQRFHLQFHADCDNGANLNINGLGPLPLKRPDGSAVKARDIRSGQWVDLIYYGSTFILSSLERPYIQDGSYLWGGTTGGTASAYTATLTPAPAAYVTGQVFNVIFHVSCNATPTINFNGLGAKTIKSNNGAIRSGEIRNGTRASLLYDGTDFFLLSAQRPLPICSGYITGFQQNVAATAVPWSGSNILDFPVFSATRIIGMSVQWSAAWTWVGSGSCTFRLKKNYSNTGDTFSIDNSNDGVLNHFATFEEDLNHSELVALTWETANFSMTGTPCTGLATLWGV